MVAGSEVDVRFKAERRESCTSRGEGKARAADALASAVPRIGRQMVEQCGFALDGCR